MKKLYLTLSVILYTLCATAQQTGIFQKNFSFNQSPFNGETRRFSFYVPSDYSNTNSYPLIIGLHACGSNDLAFRNDLIATADSLDAILICPSGNGDAINNEYGGQELQLVEFAYDTAAAWYNVRPGEIYLTGFSCNGLEALYIVLENKTKVPFAGVIPYAGAFNSANFSGKSFGNTRITPACFCMGDQDPFYSIPFYQSVLDSMAARNAIYKDYLMPGVGHTTNHPGFTQYMLDCFDFLKSNTTVGLFEDAAPSFYNLERNGNRLIIHLKNNKARYSIYSLGGQLIASADFEKSTALSLPGKGIYLLHIRDDKGQVSHQKIAW